jgi:sulfatase modifying factor 1
MKHITFIAFFLAIVMLVKGQTVEIGMKSTQKSLVQIDDSLFVSKFEVTNKQYMIFLSYLKQNKQDEKYRIARIDSIRWSDEFSFNEPYVQYYHAHPAYANYPVVNISYEGATLFCEWLTMQYNSDEKRKFKKVTFRLPTEKEWNTAAKGGNPAAIYPWEGSELRTSKGLYRCNFKRTIEDSIAVAGKLKANVDVTAPVQSYWPNEYGLYNMSGNVAEMLSVKGQTKGGSWQDTAEAMKIDGTGKLARFDNPMPTIGFRYFMDLVEK